MARAAHSTWYNWYANGLLARNIEQLARGLSGSLVIDVGCGESPYRAMLSGFARYVGFDAPGRPDSASHPDVVGDAGALPFRTASADAVLCTEVIEHVPDPAILLAEAHRVLVPGGSLLLSSPFTWHLHDEPHDYWRFTEYGLRLLLERAGFRVAAVRATNGSFGALLQARAYWLYFVSGGMRPLTRPIVWLLQAAAVAAAPLDRNRRMASNYVVLARKA
ncbi:MAG TPA: class I SAM-dependent methyltransferase [Candidatus Krumholzibacteria bacterium]|nr:class I SAM-dependent methyltransferase [Candidatus Krumholzibacteria bacterium]